MKILLWHGYLLSGSGSNIYSANLARSWRAAGHDVLLLCQEGQGDAFDFIDAVGDFASDNGTFETTHTGAAPAAGRCVLLRPAIGEILPVYVYDAYEGFAAKRFVDLTDPELDAYTSANVRALSTAIESFRPDAIVTGHEVMGPYIAKLACEQTNGSYLAKLHGSALEYAVKEQERYLSYAQGGLSSAKVVAGGSRYIITEAARVVPGWIERAVVVNPGCNTELFRPTSRTSHRPVVGFVGKLIAFKGVHHLLAALGLVENDFEAIVVGYGAFEPELQALWNALKGGDRSAALGIARRGDGRQLSDLLAWLESDAADAAYYRRLERVTLRFAGRLDHGPLSKLLPTFDALCVPSVLPEAFGMVAAEAAACGVLPIVPGHSGIGEAGAAVEETIGRPGFLTFDPADPIKSLAAAVDRVLELAPRERAELGLKAAAMAESRWSWDHVATRLLELAAG